MIRTERERLKALNKLKGLKRLNELNESPRVCLGISCTGTIELEGMHALTPALPRPSPGPLPRERVDPFGRVSSGEPFGEGVRAAESAAISRCPRGFADVESRIELNRSGPGEGMPSPVCKSSRQGS